MYESTLVKTLSFLYGSKRPARIGWLATIPPAKHATQGSRIASVRERGGRGDMGRIIFALAPAGGLSRPGSLPPRRRARPGVVVSRTGYPAPASLEGVGIDR